MNSNLHDRCEDLIRGYGLPVESFPELGLRSKEGYYWSGKQVEALAELANLDANAPVIDALKPSYVFLLLHYALTDDILDGQSEAASVLEASQYLSLAWALVEQEACDGLEPSQRAGVRRRLLGRLYERDRALRREADLRSTWRDAPDDYFAITGRSNATLAFYDIFRAVQNRETEDQALALINDLLYVLQMQDDLQDWRDDLAAGNQTLFIRRCASRIGASAGADEDEIESETYLGGYCEDYLSELILKLDKLSLDLRAWPKPTPVTQSYIARTREWCIRLLSAVLEAKVDHLQSAI